MRRNQTNRGAYSPASSQLSTTNDALLSGTIPEHNPNENVILEQSKDLLQELSNNDESSPPPSTQNTSAQQH